MKKLWFESFLFDIDDIRATKKFGADRGLFLLWRHSALATDFVQVVADLDSEVL